VVELSIGSDGTGLLISDLDIDFDVERTVTVGQQSARFTVYNAKEETRREILRRGRNVIFRAGYEDEGIGALFIGSITDAESRKSGGDWITEISASALRGQETALDRVTVSLSYAPKTRLSQPLNDLASALGLAIFGSENARFALPNGFAFAGSARKALDYCEALLRAEGASLYVDNSEIVVYRIGGTVSRFSSLILTYRSGLLSAEDITEAEESDKRRIRFETILIPKLLPNSVMTVRSPRVEGNFIVEKVQFQGDNYGGDFRASGEASE
jgi:hypothetical protein